MKADERKAWTEKINRQQLTQSLAKSKSKYGAVKTDVHGRRFDSAKEARRYLELAMLQAAKQISDLKLQPEFRIEVMKAGTFNGIPTLVYIASYFADFAYVENGQRKIGRAHV